MRATAPNDTRFSGGRPAAEGGGKLMGRGKTLLAHIIHDRFYCTRRYSAGHPLQSRSNGSRLGCQVPAAKRAGSPLGRSTYWFKYAFLPRGSAWGYPLLFSVQWVQRVASWPFRHEPSGIIWAGPVRPLGNPPQPPRSLRLVKDATFQSEPKILLHTRTDVRLALRLPQTLEEPRLRPVLGPRPNLHRTGRVKL